MVEWKKLLFAAGGAAATAAIVYYLLKEESEKAKLLPLDGKEKSKDSKAPARRRIEDVTKDEVLQILKEISQSQDEMKGYMKGLTDELLLAELDFDEVYRRVRDVQPDDPLEKYNFTMPEFDQLLDTHQNDSAVRNWISKIMGAPSPDSVPSKKAKEISVKQVLECHWLMYSELESLAALIEGRCKSRNYDNKTVTIAAQAVVGSKVQQKYGITSDEIESAVLQHHAILATDQDFGQVNDKIKTTMGRLINAGS
jgi:hypothetical protein